MGSAFGSVSMISAPQISVTLRGPYCAWLNLVSNVLTCFEKMGQALAPLSCKRFICGNTASMVQKEPVITHPIVFPCKISKSTPPISDRGPSPQPCFLPQKMEIVSLAARFPILCVCHRVFFPMGIHKVPRPALHRCLSLPFCKARLDQ